MLALTLVEVASIDGNKILPELLACQSNALFIMGYWCDDNSGPIIC